MSQAHALTYRPDIDGLRAIAVLSVVLYHFGLPLLGGGFVGVDIFFVISGFLIGGLLWREAEATGRISLARFFARRILRLAPAYVAMALGTAAAAYFLLLPFEFRAFGKSLIAATVYLSNVHFFREAGYFDTGAEDKILLHTWSLAVEEQFYIVLPLLMLVLLRNMGWLRAALWAAFALSLVASLWVLPRSQPAGFYLFPFRAWELLAGVLLAIEAHRRQFTFTAPIWLGALGLIALGIAILIIPAGPEFPGLWALLPVFGAVCVIASGRSANGLTRALSHPWMVGIGLISYSLYLWHWPVFTLITYARGAEPGLIWLGAGLVLSFALAALSWRFVERPFRRGPMPRLPRVYLGAALASATLLGIGGMIFIKDGMIERFQPPLRSHIEASADFLQDWSRCTTGSEGGFNGIEICPIGPEGAPRVLIWGDSHVRALKEGLEQLAYETDTPALIVWRAGCAPIFGLRKEESAATPAQNAACTKANEAIREALHSHEYAQILLVGRWPYYAAGQGTGRDRANQITLRVAGQSGSQVAQFNAGLIATATELGQKAQVTVLHSIPEIASYDSRHIARALSGGRLNASAAEEAARIALSEVAERRAAITPAFAGLGKAGIAVIDVQDAFCDADHCRALYESVGQYFDNNHLTNSAARRIRDRFRPVFEGASAHE